MELCLIFALVLPLLSAFIITMLSSLLPRKLTEFLGPGVILLSFLSFAYFWVQGIKNVHAPLYSWISLDHLSVEVSLLLDPLSLLMALIITGVGFLIHLYSVGYMDHDKDVARFFAVMNFFIFSMLLLVLADDLLVLFVGWEGVGLASYLLIGFWYQKPAASKAAKKAFIVNRVGDLGLLLGILFAFTLFGTSNISKILTTSQGSFEITIMTLLIFWGATAKSAQIPLHVWLPDAMEGPTPVSALIHAATMVTAGVYLVVRMHPLFALAPITLAVIAAIGLLTALFAAISAISQQDIKRVLAYSTISQLGLMFVACGFKANDAAMFHLTAHAFTKALLFLSAGSVIHMMSGITKMSQMGGLAKYFPITNILFFIGVLALSAVPPFMPFFSKELILESVEANRSYWLLTLLVSLLTAFYLTRAYLLTFYGPSSVPKEILPKEAPCVMYAPCIILAFLATIGGFFFDFGKFHVTLQVVFVVALVVFAIFLALFSHKYLLAKLQAGWQFSLKAFYINELYAHMITNPCKVFANVVNHVLEKRVIDPSMNYPATLSSKAAAIFERLQNGQIRTYLAWFVLIGCALALYIVRKSGGFT